MKFAIIIIGDEILLGQVTDTNSGEIARALAPLGWQTGEIVTVADDADAIREAVSRALARYPLVITTGGLGPTKDDITKHTLMGVFGGTLVHDPAVLENVEEIFAKRGLKINELTRTQAMVPTSCRGSGDVV